MTDFEDDNDIQKTCQKNSHSIVEMGYFNYTTIAVGEHRCVVYVKAGFGRL